MGQASGFRATLEAIQGQIDGFLSQIFIQMLSPGGSICGRLTYDLPLGCLQGGVQDIGFRVKGRGLIGVGG